MSRFVRLNVSNKKATVFITTEKSFVIQAPEVKALFVIAVLHACDTNLSRAWGFLPRSVSLGARIKISL